MVDFEKVSGEKDKGDIQMYALSTCPWCKKTKKLLKELDVQYRFIDIDTLEREKKEEVMDELREHNPACSVPTLVIDNGDEVIKGFKEEDIREALESD